MGILIPVGRGSMSGCLRDLRRLSAVGVGLLQSRDGKGAVPLVPLRWSSVVPPGAWQDLRRAPLRAPGASTGDMLSGGPQACACGSDLALPSRRGRHAPRPAKRTPFRYPAPFGPLPEGGEAGQSRDRGGAVPRQSRAVLSPVFRRDTPRTARVRSVRATRMCAPRPRPEGAGALRASLDRGPMPGKVGGPSGL